MNIRYIDYAIDPEETDACGNTPLYVLENNGTKMVLCEECFNELVSSIENIKNTHICYKCHHWRSNPNGTKYGGSCTYKLHGKNPGVKINKEDYGTLERTEFYTVCDCDGFKPEENKTV